MLRAVVPLALSLSLAACDKPQSGSDAPAKPAASASAAQASPSREDKAAEEKDREPAAAAPSKAPTPTADKAAIGKPAPDFTLNDLDGKPHSLSEHRGKLVVLEWFNPECPFVKSAHSEGPLKDMAAAELAKGDVVWLAINSGGEGRQGHGEQANRKGVETFSMTHHVLLDQSGEIGHRYGATKTPHMMLIDAEGTLVYRGAIDNAPFGEVHEGEQRTNHLASALASVRAGKPVEVSEIAAYGCTVKYAKS